MQSLFRYDNIKVSKEKEGEGMTNYSNKRKENYETIKERLETFKTMFNISGKTYFNSFIDMNGNKVYINIQCNNKVELLNEEYNFSKNKIYEMPFDSLEVCMSIVMDIFSETKQFINIYSDD